MRAPLGPIAEPIARGDRFRQTYRRSREAGPVGSLPVPTPVPDLVRSIRFQETRVPSGALSDDFKELVRSRTDIVQLVGERVALQSRRGGRELVGLCPFHDDHDPSLRVDAERQSYKCWACGEGGDCFAFVQKIENVEFRDALELLATHAGLEMPRYGRGADGTNPDGVYAGGKPTRKELFEAAGLGRGRVSLVSAQHRRRERRPAAISSLAASRAK